MPRTDVFATLRRCLNVAREANAPDAPPLDDLLGLVEERRASRRRFLKAGAIAAGASLASVTPGCLLPRFGAGRISPRVVIVGGGLSGLSAAYRLKKRGHRALVFEASSRVGGRVWSSKNAVADGVVTELGGEFIDSNHKDLLSLVSEFNLGLIDTRARSERGLTRDTYFFDGRSIGERDVIEAFRPLAARMESDLNRVGDVVDHEHPDADGGFDGMSISAYLDRVGADGFMRKLLEVAYVSEYGLDAEEQSALNLLLLIGTDTRGDRFDVYGDSDERYKVRGGNQSVTDTLAARLDGAIELGHRLEAVERIGESYRLTFAVENGAARDVDADFVVLALPFTMLRNVDLRIDMPDVKRRAINELGYGTNAKVVVGMRRPLWRDQSLSGNVLSDEPFQCAWDSSRLQGASEAAMTLYSGGAEGVRVGAGSPREQSRRLLPGLDRALPGVAAAALDRVVRFHWPSYPFSKGSYSCYRVGQWTTFGGAESTPIERLHFVGEHTSTEFQGFMNGAVQSGRAAAESILAAIRAGA